MADRFQLLPSLHFDHAVQLRMPSARRPGPLGCNPEEIFHCETPDEILQPLGMIVRQSGSHPSQEIKPAPGSAGINVPLPRDGVGFKSYKTQKTQYGYPKTIKFIMNLGVKWANENPEGPRLLIGDLSIQGGGPTPKQWGNPSAGYHKSHGSGLDFDVQVIRSDSVENPRSVSIRDSLYDRKRTQDLVNMIRNVAGKDFGLILSGDTQLQGIHRDDSHIYHLHVRLKK